jgi:hypothetical protein
MAKRNVISAAQLCSRRVGSLLFRAVLLVGLFRELCGAGGAHEELYTSVYDGGKIQLAEDAVQMTSTWFDNNLFQPHETEHAAAEAEVACAP